MFQNRYLARWQAAGLLDADTVARIQAHEASTARPVWLWALSGLGAFAIAMGVMALVAANWEELPGWLKIGVDLAVNGAVAAGLYFVWRRGWEKTRELLAILLFGLVISGIALISQVYQLTGEVWQALLVWMLVCTPFLALVTRSRLLGVVWALALTTTWFSAWEVIERALRVMMVKTEPVMVMGWIPAVALLAIGLVRAIPASTRAQGGTLAMCGALGMMALTVAPQFDFFGRNPYAGLPWAVVAAAVILAPLLWLRAATDRDDALRTGGIAFATAITLLAMMAIHHGFFGAEGDTWSARRGAQLPRLLFALAFIGYWAFLSWLALHAGKRGLFVVAFAIIAIRVFIFYWEALGGLLNTGLGLILGGFLCMGMAALGWWIAKRRGASVEVTP
ncbi:MAG: DUF2157 domain-containing protein [Rhodospirillales bacterium]|nr:MAG: DUF2157 domain-containing protein [Rhodospirillales bacterium]